MFTVKVVRVSKHDDTSEEHKTSGYEARSWDIIDNRDEKAVIAHCANGDELYIPVRNTSEAYIDGGLADVIFIENANGKTTDVVRP